MTRPVWDFDYVPVRRTDPFPASGSDFVVATENEVPGETLVSALSVSSALPKIQALLTRPPLFWYRICVEHPAHFDAVKQALERANVSVRYVSSSLAPSVMLGARADFSSAPFAQARSWPARAAREHREEKTPGRWFLDEVTGVGVDRAVCGFGAGTRLAAIDDETRDVDALDLDLEVRLGDLAPSRASSHGASIVAWAVGSRGRPNAGIEPFVGVAPDASPRLYCIPKPDCGVFWLPWAIVRAVDDGADVVVCATYVEGMTSPMLDDALEFAIRMGRGGRGTPVIMPTGREVSSAPGSVSASLTLGFGDPASDPRVLCIAPSGRDGGWFLWPDKSDKLRPFANRGPAVRLAAPGDDMAYPFVPGHRLGHAESSGASAVAAGVALLVIASNPDLRVPELYELLAATASVTSAEPEGVLADPSDVLPSGRDADRHDAKVGYGRVSAVRACLAASDPVAFALTMMGDGIAAREYVALRITPGPVAAFYSADLARWMARMIATDAVTSHTIRAVLRHLRLLAGHADRCAAHPLGVIARSVALAVHQLETKGPPAALAEEIQGIRRIVLEATRSPESARNLEAAAYRVACDLWASHSPVQGLTGSEPTPRPVAWRAG